MSTPPEGQAPEQASTPMVSTAPTSGATTPPDRRWRGWKALPHHLGRARTSTVILSVLFLAVFTLYLNVRPPLETSGTSPAGGSSDVEAPVNPLVPTAPTTPEPTEEPAPPTDPDETGVPEEQTEAPTTGSTPSTSDPGTTEPTTEPDGSTTTSGPTDPTGGTTGPDTPPTSP